MNNAVQKFVSFALGQQIVGFAHAKGVGVVVINVELEVRQQQVDIFVAVVGRHFADERPENPNAFGSAQEHFDNAQRNQ